MYVNARAIIERKYENTTQIVIQTRNKSGERLSLELPGGQVNEYESLISAVKREVMEETGLEVIHIEGQDCRIDTTNMDRDFSMECIRPFAVYQTLKGPVDSMGVYFRCKATGTIQKVGDDTLNAKWIAINELQAIVRSNAHLFSAIDLAGILFYLNEKQTN